jgi:transcriptional regulator with XRE-family HTH domain
MDTPGQAIAALRKGLGWSQDDLAAALREVSGRASLNREEVSRWENDRRSPTPYWLAHLAAALGVPVTALRAATPGPAPETSLALRAAHEWLVTEPPQSAESRSGRRIGGDLAVRVQARVVHLRHLDDELSGLDLAPIVVREYAATRRLVGQGSYRAPTGRSLLASLAELGQVTGWVLSDAGLHAQAQAHYLDGFAAAKEADDAGLAANLISCLAYQWTNLGYADDASLLAATAVKGAEGRATPTVRALLCERLAYAWAHRGDAAGAERALGRVDDLFAARTAGDGDPEWTYWLTRDEITVMAARCWTRLGDPGRAGPLLAGVLTRYNRDQVREQALYWSFLAEAHLNAGERAAAADVLETAARYAAATNSARANLRVANLRDAVAGA